MIASDPGLRCSLAYANRAIELSAQVAKIVADMKSNPPHELWHQTIEEDATPSLQDTVAAMPIGIIKAPAHCQLSTSDHPVYFSQSDGLGHPEAEVSIPLSPELALILCKRFSKAMASGRLAPWQAREINIRTIANADRWLFFKNQEPWMKPFFRKHHHTSRPHLF